jgi:hypothetical protein
MIFSVEDMEKSKHHLEEKRKIEFRVCIKCGENKSLHDFPGRIIKHLTFVQVSFLNTCSKCFAKQNSKNINKCKNKDRSYKIMNKCRRESKLLGINHNLTVSYIRILLDCPCYYCKTKSDNITLCMKNDKLGYTKSNTVPCCINCYHDIKDMTNKLHNKG